MTEKEMIEEMAKEIFNTCAWRFGRPNDYKEIFNDIAEALIKLNYRKIPEGSVVLSKDKYEYKDKKIYRNGHHIGYIDFSIYRDIKALGIGDFEIIDKRKGYGKAVINDIVDKYKTAYDLIYCFVDKKNVGAIEFYSKVGNVCFDKINDKEQYQVIFYENEVEKARKETAKEFADKVKARADSSILNSDGDMVYINQDFVTISDIDNIAKQFGVEVEE